MEVEQIEEVTSPEVDKLSVVLLESGLELTETEQIKQSYLPFFIELAQIKEEAKKINWENPTPLDEKIARDLRLRTVKVRTGSEDVKDSRKKMYILKGNVEQSSWNLLRDGCKLDEELFLQVEKAREIKAAKDRAERAIFRMEDLNPVADFVPMGLDLGAMTDEDYGKLRAGAFAQKEAKEVADKKAEEERIAQDKAKAEEDARIRAENERLQKEKDDLEAKAKKEKEALEKKLADEKAKAEKARKEAEEKARKEREIIEAELQIERDRAAKIEKEAKDKADAEAKAKREADEKAADEEKARIAAEKKAAKAPDKVKLFAWVESMDVPASARLKISDPEAAKIASEIYNKFHSFKQWAESKVNEL